MIGPIFQREHAVLPRRSRHFVARLVFAGMLFSIICTTWLLLAGIQSIRNIGDLSRFGTLVFQFLAPLQLLIVVFMAALAGANAIAHEKDRRTLVLLLMTSLTNSEVVLGKIAAGVLPSLNLFLSGLPVMMLVTLFGGVSVQQVIGVACITVAAILAAASLGATVAFWREKTFQAIAVTLLATVLWIAFWEIVAAGYIGLIPKQAATIASPGRALWEVCQPIATHSSSFGILGVAFQASGVMLLVAVSLMSLSIGCLRIWNPSREARPMTAEEDSESLAKAKSVDESERDGTRRVLAWKARRAKRVWNNPVLWREMCTWAYGRKVMIIRVAYVVFFLLAGAALQQGIASGEALGRSVLTEELIPSAARSLAPFFVVSLVIINALAVNLLLVTEISPSEFLFGKILGVMYVAKEMVLLPIVLCLYLWFQGGITTENLIFTIIGLVVMDLFVAMLGIHCGMIYSQSRHAIAVSLGTVFFLFLGVATCMMIMISFRGSFGRQLAPFLAIILGGGTGLYMALGYRNPSPAITLAAFALPFLTFFAITSFILRNQELTVCSVIAVAYAFATAAMMVPALSEFDFATGRSRTAEDES
jgi:hypothetical protein